MSDFEFLYKRSQEKCIEEIGEIYEVYDEFQMKSMCEYFYNLGTQKLQVQLDELKRQRLDYCDRIDTLRSQIKVKNRLNFELLLLIFSCNHSPLKSRARYILEKYKAVSDE
jgi:hypothetical protein